MGNTENHAIAMGRIIRTGIPMSALTVVKKLGQRWICRIDSKAPSYVQGEFIMAYEAVVEYQTGTRPDIQLEEMPDANAKRNIEEAKREA